MLFVWAGFTVGAFSWRECLLSWCGAGRLWVAGFLEWVGSGAVGVMGA